MTRQQYIDHLELVRDSLTEVIKTYHKASLDDEYRMEEVRAKKTSKMFDDLYSRLFEDSAISHKILIENRKKGIGEQGSLFNDIETENDSED